MSESVLQLLARALQDLEVWPTEPLDGPWLSSGEDAPHFRLRRVAGQPCLWHPERPAQVAADLDAAEALLNRVEAVSGWRFEPAELRQEQPAAVIAIGDEQTVLELAIDPHETPSSTLQAAAAAAPHDPRLPVARVLHAVGPLIAVDQLSSLAVGDLVLLPDTMPATLGGADAISCAINLRDGVLQPSRWEQPQPPAFAAALEITLPPHRLSDEAMQPLASGGEVPIGPVSHGAEVTLAVGGRAFGSGQIARLGQAIAVQIVALKKEEPTVS